MSITVCALSRRLASSRAAMLSLFVGGVVRLRCATRSAMLVLSTADLAEVLGLERRGHLISGEVSGGAMTSGDSKISCDGDDCASGVTPLGSNVRSCTVSWKFTLGACGWGVTGAKVCAGVVRWRPYSVGLLGW